MSKQGLGMQKVQGSIPEEMELPDPIRFDEAESKDRLKYSSAFLIFRVAHMLAYFVIIQVFGFSYFPLFWCMAGAAFQTVGVWLEWWWQRKGTPHGLAALFSPPIVMAAALVVDAGLIAMTRQDVQFTMLENVSSIDQTFGSTGSLDCIGDPLAVQACQQQHQWHSFITTQVFQAVLLYFILFVLKASHTLAVGGLCVAIYSAITLTASSTLNVFSWMMHGDLLILVCVYMMGVIARHKTTLSEHSLHNVLETHSNNVFRQKVRRCRQKMLSTCTADQKTYKLLEIDDSESQGTCDDSIASEVSCSAQSAPAIFQSGRAARRPVCPKGDGDCLPATGVVWVENSPAPRSLNTLMPGERVLCYDNIGRGLAYAPVVQSHPAQNSASADWVMVTLKDGTQLSMTADHPVAVQPSEKVPTTNHTLLDMGRRCVRAEELNAEQDCLMVLKMVATPVASITKEAADSATVTAAEDAVPENQWITLTVEQPERHELFVSTRNKFGAPGPPIAVGSSDRLPSEMSPTRMLCVKNSFIDGFEEEVPVLKRSNSAPPSLSGGLAMESCVRNLNQCPSSVESASPFADKLLTDCDLLSAFSGGTSLSASTESSGLQNLAQVKVGPGTGDSTGLMQAVRLTDFLTSKAAGVSIGSLHAPQQGCSPCSFHFTWQRNPARRAPCKASYMCEYCHDDSHHEKWRSKFRKRRHPKHCIAITGVLPPDSEIATDTP